MGLVKGSFVKRETDGVHLCGVISANPNEDGYTYVQWFIRWDHVKRAAVSCLERIHIEEVEVVPDDTVFDGPGLHFLRRKILR